MQNVLEPTARQWLDDLVRQHDERLARRGAGYVPRVNGWKHDETHQTVMCEVPGSDGKLYRVTLRLLATVPIDFDHPPDGLDAVCTCPYSEGGRFLCKHTFAAATRLAQLWDAHPTARIDRLLSRNDRAASTDEDNDQRRALGGGG